jgi:hypothetical protein
MDIEPFGSESGTKPLDAYKNRIRFLERQPREGPKIAIRKIYGQVPIVETNHDDVAPNSKHNNWNRASDV